MSLVVSIASARQEPRAIHSELDAKDLLLAGQTTSALATLSVKQKEPLASILVLHQSVVQMLIVSQKTTNQHAGAGPATKAIPTTLSRAANHRAPRSGVAPTLTASLTPEMKACANASKASVEIRGKEENAHLIRTVQTQDPAPKARSVLAAIA